MNNGGPAEDWRRRHQRANHLPSLFYLPDYVSGEDEERLLREARASKAKWVQLSGRRLQNHGGVVHAKGLIPAPLPAWLQPLLRRLAGEGGPGGLYGGKPPNHVLVNSYLPGEGIMPHEDGPAYHPVVAILSLGAPAVLRFRRKPPQEGDATATPGEGCGATPGGLTRPAAASSDTGGDTGGGDTGGGSSPTSPGSKAAAAGSGGAGLTAATEAPSPRGHPGGTAAGPLLAAPSGPPESCPAAAVVGPACCAAVAERPAMPPPSSPPPSSRSGAEAAGAPGLPTASLLLQPRSLVVFQQAAFTDCLHYIEEVTEEVMDESVANLDMYGITPGAVLPRGAERISLTVRRVARVMPAILRPRGT